MFKTIFVVFALVAAAFAGENVRQERAITYGSYGGYAGVVSPLAYSAGSPYTYGSYNYGYNSHPVVSTYGAYPYNTGVYSGVYPTVRYV